jgi:hypothetical protein
MQPMLHLVTFGLVIQVSGCGLLSLKGYKTQCEVRATSLIVLESLKSKIV